MYKVISKIIVGRLKTCIAKLVSPFQAGFVLGRPIHENIIIAKEIMHTIHQKKGKKGIFTVKIDLSKAYDKIIWECIWQVLMEAKLPVELINIFMHAVISNELNMNWHGARCEFFRPQRGIRQGDPISSYLLVLCMDKLSHIIEQDILSRNWKAVRMGE